MFHNIQEFYDYFGKIAMISFINMNFLFQYLYIALGVVKTGRKLVIFKTDLFVDILIFATSTYIISVYFGIIHNEYSFEVSFDERNS